MESYNENQLLKQIANRYAERYGEILLEENAELERQGFAVVTPRMDKKAGRMEKSRGMRRWAGGISALAAAILLVLMIPRMIGLNETGVMAPESSAPAAHETEQDAVPEPPQASESDVRPQPELLPLAFTLPGNFSVADSKLDNGKSVYYLANTELDDVVMTMELAPAEDVFAGLTPVEINGHGAYYKYTRDFGMLAFEKSGITYVLTCRHDVNTLVPLAEAIL